MNTTNDVINKLRRSFLGVTGAFIIGLPLTFIAQIVLARLLTVEEFGGYGFALSVATVASIPVIAGLPMLLTREVAGYLQAVDLGKYRSLVVGANGWVAGSALVLVLVLYAFSVALPESTLAIVNEHLLFFALIIPVLGLNAIRSGVMKGLGFPALSELPTQVLLPLTLIAGFILLDRSGNLTLSTALLWYLAANTVVLLVAVALLFFKQPESLRQHALDLGDLPRWARSMLPFAMMSAIWTLSAQLSMVLLGLFGDLEAVAAMRVAERGAMLISLPMMLMNTSISPLIVGFHRKGETQGLQSLLRYAARMASLAGLPAALLLIVFGKWLISVTFGPEYAAAAYGPMVILVIGHALTLFLGPAGICLVMCGREKLNLWVQIVALGAFLVIAVSLIGSYGAVGAALATSVSLVLGSLLSFVGVVQFLRIRSSVF